MISDDPISSILILRSTCSVDAPLDPSLSLWCDMTVLPEIHGSNDAVVHVLEQGLNPCGIDNILLLQGLHQGHGYLLSLSNCFTLVNDDKRIPVFSHPSTFFFALQSHPSLHDDSGVFINEKQSFSQLSVTFDVTHALDHIFSDRDDVDAPHPTLIGNDTMPACHAPNDVHEEVLRLLETLAEREARDVDMILTGLSLLMVVLLSVYAWTTYIVAKKSKGKVTDKMTGKITAQTNRLSPARSLNTNFDVSADADVRGAENCETPFNAVTIDRSCDGDAPSLTDETCDHVSNEKLVFLGSRSTKFPSSSSPLFPHLSTPHHTGLVAKPVSPCSQLEKDWEQKKVARRSRRRVLQTQSPSFLLPVSIPEGASFVDSSSFKARKRIIPLVDVSNEMSHTNGAPLCPTLISDESFLNDYW